MMTPPFPDKKYSVIYADPAWQHDGNFIPVREKDQKYKTNPADFYPTMPTLDICDLPVRDIADTDCLLFMWACSPMLEDALQVGKAWGFDFKTVAFAWDKQLCTSGFYTLSQVELCLVFKKGKIPQPRGKRNIKQFISARRGAHSVKPYEVRHRINEMFPHHEKIELFARERFDGWDAWGNEV